MKNIRLSPSAVACIRGMTVTAPFSMTVFISFMALAPYINSAGMTAIQGITLTATTFAVPAQIKLIEMASQGSSLKEVAVIIVLLNGRFFLMSLAVLNHVRQRSLLTLASILMISNASFTSISIEFQEKKSEINEINWLLLGATASNFAAGLVGYLIGATLITNIDERWHLGCSIAICVLIGSAIVSASMKVAYGTLFVLASIAGDLAIRIVSPGIGTIILGTVLPLIFMLVRCCGKTSGHG